ncbi:hypothetical protein CCO03_18990 [Comamonas serinivorans]|uniref:Uncharacterized protein n=1 Tax=Comamonas serinivorans TaxID=1082851 RepID=A0A1Y0ESH7_9BURK|nr:hypothetical protein [Comamonas serinivorans]ARU06468.1 hypothetical protein CCO03_18990 [Comamonas serinivorans]
MNALKPVLAAALCAALSGCLVPEKFTADATFKPDGSYRYRFDGTVANAMVIAATRQKPGGLTDKDKAAMQRELDKERQRPGIQQLKAIDDTRLALKFEDDFNPGPLGMKAATYEVLQVSDKDWATRRVLTVTGPALKDKDRQALQELGIQVAGKVSITLPPKAKVISHNANGTPGLLSKAYTWTVGSLADQPRIEFQLP